MLCIGVAAVLSDVLPLQRSYWVILAVAVVLKPDFGSVFARALQYGAGTMIGAAAAGLILVTHPPQALLLVPLVTSAALMPFAMSRTYGYFGVVFTPLVVLLIGLISDGGWRLAQDRLVDILLGCGSVLCLGYAPWPSSWHANLPRDLADAIQQAARHLEQAWLPAVIALEQLLEAVTAAAVTHAGQPPPATDVDELAAVMRHTSTAVRSGTPLQAARAFPARRRWNRSATPSGPYKTP